MDACYEGGNMITVESVNTITLGINTGTGAGWQELMVSYYFLHNLCIVINLSYL